MLKTGDETSNRFGISYPGTQFFSAAFSCGKTVCSLRLTADIRQTFVFSVIALLCFNVNIPANSPKSYNSYKMKKIRPYARSYFRSFKLIFDLKYTSFFSFFKFFSEYLTKISVKSHAKFVRADRSDHIAAEIGSLQEKKHHFELDFCSNRAIFSENGKL